MHQKILTKQFYLFYRDLSDLDKKPFIEFAENLRLNHKMDYPGYKFAQLIVNLINIEFNFNYN